MDKQNNTPSPIKEIMFEQPMFEFVENHLNQIKEAYDKMRWFKDYIQSAIEYPSDEFWWADVRLLNPEPPKEDRNHYREVASVMEGMGFIKTGISRKSPLPSRQGGTDFLWRKPERYCKENNTNNGIDN